MPCHLSFRPRNLFYMSASVVSMDRKPDVDEILRSLGKWGRYQILQTFLTAMNAVPYAFHLLSVVFIGKCSKTPTLNKFSIYCTMQKRSIFIDIGSFIFIYYSANINP